VQNEYDIRSKYDSISRFFKSKNSDYNLALKTEKKLANKQIYNISEETDYKNAIIYFISGMSDNFAIDVLKIIPM
jgi:dGTP triphosphohydrolase